LFSIARNKAADHFRQDRGNASLDENEGPRDEQAAFEIDGRREELRSLLRELPEDDRELLRLRYVGELDYAEIAGLLGRKTDAVKKATYRLLARLQSEMEKSQ
jgi:RNA polymerase sigma-70 factor (ECF subfamily)